MTIFEAQRLIPKREQIQTAYHTVDGWLKFVLTSNVYSEGYTLYEVEDFKLKKLGKGNNPLELEERYSVEKVMRCCNSFV